VEEQPETPIQVDLRAQRVMLPDGQEATFSIDPYRKECLLEGLDDLGYLLSKEPAIAAYEASHPAFGAAEPVFGQPV